MSKYTVLKSFIDKHSLIGYNSGNTFESDDLERVSFLSEAGYIHVPNANNDKQHEHSQDDGQTLEELKEKAKSLGLKGYSKLNKGELIAIIEASEAEKASE